MSSSPSEQNGNSVLDRPMAKVGVTAGASGLLLIILLTVLDIKDDLQEIVVANSQHNLLIERNKQDAAKAYELAASAKEAALHCQSVLNAYMADSAERFATYDRRTVEWMQSTEDWFKDVKTWRRRQPKSRRR